MPGWDFVFSRDLGGGLPPAAKTDEDAEDCNINAGVFLVRSSPKAHCVLREWDKQKETLWDDQIGLRQIWLIDACQMRNSTYIFDWGDLQIFFPLHGGSGGNAAPPEVGTDGTEFMNRGD